MTIKLDLTDKKILTELDKDCRIPASQLAKITHKSRQAIEYRIQKMTERGIITSFNAAINPNKMGYKSYKLYFKLRNIPERKKELFDHLRQTGNIYWMGEFSGTWDLIFAIFTKGDEEFFDIKNELVATFNDIIIEENTDILIDFLQFNKRYFTNEPAITTTGAGKVVNNQIDALDAKILSIIANNARIPIVELAKKVQSTASIVTGRLKNFEKKEIIIQYRIGIDLSKIGLEIYKALIKMDRFSKTDEQKFFAYLSNTPNTHYIIRNINQIEPEIVAKNYHEYYHLLEELKKAFPHIIRTIDSVLMITDEWTPGFEKMLHANN
jgi:Lrp/AsnC family leucine-responsive transcriptional regulator